jgi:exodeoxyribonuclease VII small subunit
MSFEADLDRLAAIIAELGREDVELDRALALFEEGIERLRTATGELSRAEARVQQLIEQADGEFGLADFRA